jgi:hypothetical protein
VSAGSFQNGAFGVRPSSLTIGKMSQMSHRLEAAFHLCRRALPSRLAARAIGNFLVIENNADMLRDFEAFTGNFSTFI